MSKSSHGAEINRNKTQVEKESSRIQAEGEHGKEGGNVADHSVQQPLSSSFITNFFNIVPKTAEDKLILTADTDTFFKRCLGRKPNVTALSVDQEKALDKLFKPRGRNFKALPLKTLQDSLKNRFQQASLIYKKSLKTKIIDERDRKANQRFVTFKQEDHLFHSYGFSGRFAKTSAVLTGRRPLVQDQEVIDYDLDSDEDMEDMNGESINSDDKDDEEEEDEDEDDGFVVADGYFSDEELGASLDADEKSTIRVYARNYGQKTC